VSITVIIPTYRRPQDLKRCLEALKQQTRPAEQILVTVRDSDAETWNFLEQFDPYPLPLTTITVTLSGVVAAMNAGLDAATEDIIAFTDDDAAPHTDWLERLEAHYLSDSRIGAVGGRDWMYYGTKLMDASTHPGASDIVGKLQWFGRVIGNHHIGEGQAREVDVLKGVNVSYRHAAIDGLHFDGRMRGTGAQVHFEVAICLTLKRAGWKLVYDPSVAVDHYPGRRFDEDQRNSFNAIAFMNAVHNETLALLEHLSWFQKFIFIVWAIMVGTRDALGFLQLLRLLPKEGNLAWDKWLASIRGRWLGFCTWLQSANHSFST
jgi:glycosyltransferase involved in cell wall biosynthesis